MEVNMSGKLDAIVSQINKQYKEDIASNGIPDRHFKKIPFTSPMINYMTYGGIPRGRIIEFGGEENGGKTTTALDIVSNAQNLFHDEYIEEMDKIIATEKQTKEQKARLDYLYERGEKKIVYCDCENTLDVDWAKKLGVDVDTMVLIKPMSQSAEEIFEMLLKMIETDEVGLVIIDSLGVMLSQQAYEKDMTEKTYGGIAMALTLFSKKAEMLCTKYDCTIVGINQVRDDMSGFGRIITTGGRAWRHNCSMRLIFRKGDYIDADNNSIKRSSTSPAGNLVEVAIEKTKVCKPDRRNGYYTLNYTYGIDAVADTVELACYYDIIQKAGAWFSVVDTETGEIIKDGDQELKFQGKAALLEYIRNDEDFRAWLIDKVDGRIVNE